MTELQTMPLRFRVWDKESKKFCIPSEVSKGYELIYVNDGDYGYSIELVGRMVGKLGDNAVVSQDTGLVDRNNAPIFTGDIVKWKDELWEVIYDSESGGVFIKNGNREYSTGSVRLWELTKEIDSYKLTLEVVGNIWEENK